MPLASGVICLSAALCPPSSWTEEHLLEWVYEGFDQQRLEEWSSFYTGRACVAPTNAAADTLNNAMLSRLTSASEHVSYSRDSALTDILAACDYSMDSSDYFIPAVAILSLPTFFLPTRLNYVEVH